MSTRAILLILALFLTCPFPTGEAWAKRQITVLLWNEESRYLECKRGILEELERNGYHKSAAITVADAQSSKAQMADLVKRTAKTKPDLLVTVGTTATLAAVREIKDIPLVFGLVYDPVEAGIVGALRNPGGNVTGASSLVPMGEVVAALKALKPVTRLAVFYTPGERNSELQLLELQKIQQAMGIRVTPVIYAQEEALAETMRAIGRTADAIYLTGGSPIGEAASRIAEAATQAKIITVTNIPDLAAKGVLLGVCTDAYQVGRLTGTKAVRVLKGAKPAAIPIEYPKKLDIVLNLKTAAAGPFTVTPDFMKMVTRTIK